MLACFGLASTGLIGYFSSEGLLKHCRVVGMSDDEAKSFLKDPDIATFKNFFRKEVLKCNDAGNAHHRSVELNLANEEISQYVKGSFRFFSSGTSSGYTDKFYDEVSNQHLRESFLAEEASYRGNISTAINEDLTGKKLGDLSKIKLGSTHTASSGSKPFSGNSYTAGGAALNLRGSGVSVGSQVPRVSMRAGCAGAVGVACTTYGAYIAYQSCKQKPEKTAEVQQSMLGFISNDKLKVASGLGAAVALGVIAYKYYYASNEQSDKKSTDQK